MKSECLYCYDGIKKFCNMEDTVLRDELIDHFALYGLFLCDHTTYTDWADWYNHWKDDMTRYYHIHDVLEYDNTV